MTFIEAPSVVREQLSQPGIIPATHFEACSAQNMSHTGNAAGNTEDFLDLTGANVSIAPLPSGFTPKGIVALTFSIVAGLIGVAVVTWYGLGEMGAVELQREERVIEKLNRDMKG